MKIVPVKSNEHTTTKREKLLYRISKSESTDESNNKNKSEGRVEANTELESANILVYQRSEKIVKYVHYIWLYIYEIYILTKKKSHGRFQRGLVALRLACWVYGGLFQWAQPGSSQ